MIIFCPHSSLTQRHERPESFPHLPCGCPRASARACHNLPQMAYGEAVDTREFPRPALLQRAAAGSQAWRISTIRIILAMNCARYTTLCTVASVAYIATRPMHHVSHARESSRALAASKQPHFVALNPFQASINSRRHAWLRARQHVLPSRQRCRVFFITTSQTRTTLRKFTHELLRLLCVS